VAEEVAGRGSECSRHPYILLIFTISVAILDLAVSRLIRPSDVSERLPNWSAGMKINLMYYYCLHSSRFAVYRYPD
jgi:hypothetical protein